LPEGLPIQNSPVGAEDPTRLAGATSRLSGSEIAGFCAFVGCYLAIVGWFKWVDVYHNHFATDGALVVAYNFFRVLFGFYLFWIISAPGAFLIRAVERGRVKASLAPGTADAVSLNFFAGAGIWHLVLFALGYLNLYTVPVALCLTVPAVALSFFDFVATLRAVRSWFKRPSGCTSGLRLGEWLFLAAAIVAALFLLAAKGLYPAGGNDYFAHYFRFYEEVIDSHGIWPNHVWYHYFYSKGAGLYFLAMLLTDSLAPQLVTFCFFIAAGLVVSRFLARFSPDSVWPWVGPILLFSIYVYTPGRGEFRGNGGWGDFEKMHELNAALIVSIFWMVTMALDSDARQSRPWLLGAALAVAAAIILTVPTSYYLGMVFCILTALLLVLRRWQQAVRCFFLVCVSGVVLLAVLGINYATTGLANDQPLLFFFPLADVEKLYRWGVLPQVILIYQGTQDMVQSAVPIFSRDFGWQLAHFLRAYILFPLFAGALLLTLAASTRPSFRARAVAMLGEAPVPVLASALLAFVVVACVGRAQYISFFRYSSFVVPLLIVLGTALWSVSLDYIAPNFNSRANYAILLGLPVIAAVCTAMIATFQDPDLFRSNLRNSWRFLSGTYSIDRAYTTQSYPGRFPWGGIYPGARGAYNIVGPRTLIWSFHSSSFCMLPNCLLGNYPAFLMGRAWDRIMFGTPEEARDALQKAGINYFLYSRELGFADPLMTAPLFSPDQISHYLGIRWTDGTSALLTWLNPDIQPFDESWLQAYRRTAATAESLEYLKGVFARLRATPHPWHSVVLP